ncbi:hypothetical protein Sjap_017011 [Stephania japonica]|uniref:Uncharacterized protein n=1 Tax=Stephania japonica TaxID=461633 RepID=A0AAP0I5C6_9MAGN
MVASVSAVAESEEMVGWKKRQSAKSTVGVDSGTEDLCFVCLDGREDGEMVGCGRRDCPKVYHLRCVNQDERILSDAGRWTCGRLAFMQKIRSNGFCDQCIKLVMRIEDDKPRDEVKKKGNHLSVICFYADALVSDATPFLIVFVQSGPDFDDELSWDSHFKDYWIDLKNKLSITLNELKQARNLSDNKDFATKYGISDSPIEDIETRNSRRSNTERQFESSPKDGSAEAPQVTDSGGKSALNCTNWASNELLELVGYMKNGDTSFLSQLDARAVLLEYIARNRLRDSAEKSHIVCDSRLQKLFGKSHVKHFEMLRLFDSHLLIKEDNQAEVHTKTCGVQEMQEVQHNSLIMCQGSNEPKLDDKSQEKLMILRDAGLSTKKRKQTNSTRKCLTVNPNFCAQKGPIAASGESEHVAGKDGKDSLGNGCRIDSSGKMCGYLPNQGSNSNSNSLHKLKNCMVALASDADTLAGNIQASVRITESAEASPLTNLVQPSHNEMTSKMWYYEDPKGKTQGPFSMQQLDKWSRSSQFPANLKIWKNVENREVSIVLIDALNDLAMDITQDKPNQRPPSQGPFLVFQFIARLMGIAFSLASLWLMTTNKQTTVVYGLTVDAKYSYSSAFKYFVAANAGASMLTLLGLICLLLPLQAEASTSLYSSSICAAAAFGWVGKYGNTHTGWMAICDKFSAFCNRSQNSVGVAVVATLLFLISMIGSVIKLSKEC